MYRFQKGDFIHDSKFDVRVSGTSGMVMERREINNWPGYLVHCGGEKWTWIPEEDAVLIAPYYWDNWDQYGAPEPLVYVLSQAGAGL